MFMLFLRTNDWYLLSILKNSQAFILLCLDIASSFPILLSLFGSVTHLDLIFLTPNLLLLFPVFCLFCLSDLNFFIFSLSLSSPILFLVCLIYYLIQPLSLNSNFYILIYRGYISSFPNFRLPFYFQDALLFL